MNFFVKKKYFSTLFCTLIIFFVNFFVPSYTNGFPKKINFNLNQIWDNPRATQVYMDRRNSAEFSRRPIVLEAQKTMHESFKIPYQFSFNLINFLFIFAFFSIIPILSEKINKQNIGYQYIIGFTLLSFPIIFAFFGSICSYDDFIQYFFIALSLIFFIDNRRLLSILFFTISCITRETSFIYLPFFLIHDLFINRTSIIKLFYWLIPIVFYFLFLLLYLKTPIAIESKEFLLNQRFYAWQSNFKDFNSIRETTSVLAIMTLLPILLLIVKLKTNHSCLSRYWSWIIIGLIFINSILVLITGLAREARLFFLPLILGIPVFHTEIKAAYLLLKNQKFELNWLFFQKLTLIFIASISIGLVWYKPMTVGTGYIFKTYAVLYFFISLNLFYFIKNINLYIKKTSNKPSKNISEFKENGKS